MFNLVRGIEVGDLTGISEAYYEKTTEDGQCTILINVSAEHIAAFFRCLLQAVGEPGYFIFEHQVDKAEEEKLRKNKTDPFHKNVYYLDNISVAKAVEIFDKFEKLFVEDGFIYFGYGANKDEVFVEPYKIFHIYTDTPDKFRGILTAFHLEKHDNLKTVWDNFSPASPGRRIAIKEKPTLWDILDDLKVMGFYLAEVRDD